MSFQVVDLDLVINPNFFETEGTRKSPRKQSKKPEKETPRKQLEYESPPKKRRINTARTFAEKEEVAKYKVSLWESKFLFQNTY